MKLLAIRPDKIGDFITTLPAIYILKKNLNVEITVVISSINYSIAKECDFIDHIIIYKPKLSYLYNSFKNYDIAITFFSNTTVGLALFLARVKIRIAPATKIAQIFYNHRIKQKRSQVLMSEFEYNIDLVKKYLNRSIDTTFPDPFFSINTNKVIQTDKKVIAFHIGFGGSSESNLSLSEYVELARLVDSSKNFISCFTFGPDDENIYNEIKSLYHDEFYYYKSTDTVYEFMKVISSFTAFISTSTGPFHLASALGVDTFTLFGNSLFASSKRWCGIGNLTKQNNYMLPTLNINKREDIFIIIRRDLFIYIS